jgi:hypothetical protein
MATSTKTYRIVCVTTEHPHRHITEVGTGADPSGASKQWTVTAVRNAIDNGDTFYTEDAKGNTAAVLKDTCHFAGCTVRTIRSHSDASKDNNLDNMRACAWKS